MKGYHQALNDGGIQPDESLIVSCTNEEDKDLELIKNLLNQKIRPDGIFAAVERYAIGTYQVCKELGLNIPKDVKVISFSNLQTAALLNPPLTTITQPAFDIGKEAASLLFKSLEKKKFSLKDENVVFQSALIQRESTAK